MAKFLTCSINPFGMDQSIIAIDSENPKEQKILAKCHLDNLPELLNVASQSFGALDINLYGPIDIIEEIATNAYKYNSIYCHNKENIKIHLNP